MSVPLTLPERRALVEAADYLSVAISQDLTQLADGAFYAEGPPVAERACECLTVLRVLVPAGRRRTWRFAVPLDRVRSHVDALTAAKPGQVDVVLSVFLQYACGARRALPDTRAAFDPGAGFVGITQALLSLRYLERVGSNLRWTDRASAIMQTALLWDANGTCMADLFASQDEMQARHFLSDLPDWLHAKFAQTVLDEGDMAGLHLLRRHWSGVAWTPVPEPVPRPASDVGITLTLYTVVTELIRGGRHKA